MENKLDENQFFDGITRTEYIAQDTGSKVKGQVIDIYFENHEDAENYGCKYQEIYAVEVVR